MVMSLKRKARGNNGFTLVEVLVVVGLLTLGLGLVGSGVFQSISLHRWWREDALATNGLRHTGSWLTTDLVDGAPGVGAAVFSWTDSASVPHTAAYSLSGDLMVRNLDGVPIELARRVVSTSFSRVGKTLQVDMEVQTADVSTRSMSFQVYMRMLD